MSKRALPRFCLRQVFGKNLNGEEEGRGGARGPALSGPGLWAERGLSRGMPCARPRRSEALPEGARGVGQRALVGGQRSVVRKGRARLCLGRGLKDTKGILQGRALRTAATKRGPPTTLFPRLFFRFLARQRPPFVIRHSSLRAGYCPRWARLCPGRAYGPREDSPGVRLAHGRDEARPQGGRGGVGRRALVGGQRSVVRKGRARLCPGRAYRPREDSPGARLARGRDEARPSQGGRGAWGKGRWSVVKDRWFARGGPGFVRAGPIGHEWDSLRARLARGRDEARPSRDAFSPPLFSLPGASAPPIRHSSQTGEGRSVLKPNDWEEGALEWPVVGMSDEAFADGIGADVFPFG